MLSRESFLLHIKSLIWDDWNINHIKKHKVSVFEVEEAVRAKKIKSLKGHSGRILILGKTKKDRFLTVVLAKEEDNCYYVVTARDQSRKERRFSKNEKNS